MPSTLLVRVCGPGFGDVLPPFDAFMKQVGDHAVIRMSDPMAFSSEDPIDETIELEVRAAESEQEARTIAQAIIDQVPGGAAVLTPL